MSNPFLTAALIGLLTPLPSVATPIDRNGCYSTRGNGYVCYVRIDDDAYSVAFNHPAFNTNYPTVFYVNCVNGGFWTGYGPLPKEQMPAFAEAFCEGRRAENGTAI